MERSSFLKDFHPIVILFMLASACSVFGEKSNSLQKRAAFHFKNSPEGWKKRQTDQAQHFFESEEGSVFYANSYCGHYNQPLKKIALKHIKELGNVKIDEQSSFRHGSRKGLYSKIFSKYKGKLILLHHFGLKVGDCYYDLNAISSPTEEIEPSFKSFIEAMQV